MTSSISMIITRKFRLLSSVPDPYIQLSIRNLFLNVLQAPPTYTEFIFLLNLFFLLCSLSDQIHQYHPSQTFQNSVFSHLSLLPFLYSPHILYTWMLNPVHVTSKISPFSVSLFSVSLLISTLITRNRLERPCGILGKLGIES